MAQYSYTAVNKKGERIKGSLDAPNEAEARVILRAQQLRPLRLAKAGAMDFDLGKIGGGGKASTGDVLLFTRQLSILISSGIPLVQGLEMISGQMVNPAIKQIIAAIKEKVSGGGFLWEALAAYKDTFPDIYVSMVRAGEAAGALDTILKRLIKYLDDADRLRKLLKGAMIYPIAIVVVAVTVIIVMMVFVIPKFEEMLKGAGQELPGPTRFVIDASHFIQDNIVFILLGIAGTYYLVRSYLKTEDGRRFFDFWSLKVPLFGPVFLKIAVARFARTMQTLLTSGINILDAIAICRNAVGNKTVEDGLIRMKNEVEQGKTLAASMGKLPIFPNMVVQMVTVGETTGNVDKMLERIADFYEEEVNNLVANMTKLIEPVVLVVLGGAVGGLMIAMYLPIFKMAGGVGG